MKKTILTIRKKLLAFRIVLFLLLATSNTGCIGDVETGEDSRSNAQVSSSVEALPSVYDFGIVTLGNSPVALKAKLQNNGTSNIKVSSIVLSDIDNFGLDLDGGSNPCTSKSPTINAGNNCTVEVSFHPQFAGLFNANLQVKVNDSSNTAVNLQLNGSAEPVTDLNVRINQVGSDMQCPAAKVTAYVSVIDQGGYAVAGLIENDFVVYENINPVTLTDFAFVSQVTAPISIALVMDYSGSITTIPEALSDMEEAAVNFIEQLGTEDEAEIIKFGTRVEIVQEFISDKILLTDAINSPTDVGRYTSLYDAAWQAVEDTALRLKTRKAIIVLTDGVDNGMNLDLSDVINHANDKGIPIFTIGLGDFDKNILEQMANDTGGEFFDSGASDNLRNIYAQLADVFFENQYVLDYISSAGDGDIVNLKIEASLSQTVTGDDTKELSPCP
jgi:Ca-activated chloride channel family protein